MICRTSNKSRQAGRNRVNDETTGRQARPFHMRVFIRLLHFVFLFTRGATLGVRAACYDGTGRIFLVRHTYLPGWYLPGGGVERVKPCSRRFTRKLGGRQSRSHVKA